MVTTSLMQRCPDLSVCQFAFLCLDSRNFFLSHKVSEASIPPVELVGSSRICAGHFVQKFPTVR